MATESFFSNASLAYLASAGAGKDGKTYSIKPTDGTGDFTFSRGSNLAATRVGPTGLIEKGRENKLEQSNQFDTSPWVQSLGGVGGLISGQSGYDGTNDAWKLNSKGATFPYIAQAASQDGVHTFSVYAKRGEVDFIRLVIIGGSNPEARFDLLNGSAPFSTGGVLYTNIEAIGTDGWYRCSLTTNVAGTSYRFYPMVDTGNFASLDDGIYIQDSQVEVGTLATDYIESGASTGKAGLLEDEPRFDYSGGATCPSLLLEPSRTNLVKYSEYIAGYSSSNTTITQNYGISPEGVKNSARVQFSGSGFIAFSVTDYTNESTSMYVKGTAGEQIRFGKGANVAQGALYTLTGYWQRIVYSSGSSGTTFIISNYSGATANDFEVYGLQHEEGSYPTSYIPNHSGGSVTRGADGSLSNSSFSSIFGASSLTQYTIFLEVKNANDTDSSTSIISKGTNDQGKINLLGGNNLAYYSTATGYATGNNISDGNTHKYLLSANNGTIKQFFDGALIDTNTNALDELTAISIGGSPKDLNVVQYLVFPEALSDADCISLTTL